MTEAQRFEMEVFAKVAGGLDKPLDPATQAVVDQHVAAYARHRMAFDAWRRRARHPLHPATPEEGKLADLLFGAFMGGVHAAELAQSS